MISTKILLWKKILLWHWNKATNHSWANESLSCGSLERGEDPPVGKLKRRDPAPLPKPKEVLHRYASLSASLQLRCAKRCSRRSRFFWRDSWKPSRQWRQVLRNLKWKHRSENSKYLQMWVVIQSSTFVYFWCLFKIVVNLVLATSLESWTHRFLYF